MSDDPVIQTAGSLSQRIKVWFFGSGGVWGLGGQPGFFALIKSFCLTITVICIWLYISLPAVSNSRIDDATKILGYWSAAIIALMIALLILGKLLWHPWGKQIGFVGAAKLGLFVLCCSAVCAFGLIIVGLLGYMFTKSK